MIVWTVWVGKYGRCTFEHFEEAWEDWKTHEGEWRWVYPKFMTKRKFQSLPEHNGW